MLTNDIDLSYEMLEADSLLDNIHDFIRAYQETRETLFAWLVYRAANRLLQHPDYEGTPEECCALRRLAMQWKLLAFSASGSSWRAA